MPEFYCCVSGEPIPEDRVEALRLLGVPPHKWTRVEHSQTQKLKGVIAGHGLILADYLKEEGILKTEEVFLEQGDTI